MEITLLIKSAIGLIVLLAILVFLLVLPSSRKKEVKPVLKTSTPQPSQQNTDLSYLRTIIKNRKTTTKGLQEALDLVIKHHGSIHKKLGLRPHPDFDVYKDILFTICRHPSTNKDVIVKFNMELEKLNPEYKAEINEAITKGLNSRGA